MTYRSIVSNGSYNRLLSDKFAEEHCLILAELYLIQQIERNSSLS